MPSTQAKPLPEPTPETAAFWEGCREHELRIQHCNPCDAFYFYPRPFCPTCWSSDVEWRAVSGDATLHTYVINHRPAPGFEGDAPYVIAIVQLAEGPHLMSGLVGVDPDPEQLPVGLPLRVVFDDVSADVTLPRFRPRGER